MEKNTGFTRHLGLCFADWNKQTKPGKIVSRLENFTWSLYANNIIVQIDVLEAAKSVFKFRTENLPITKTKKEYWAKYDNNMKAGLNH